MSTIEMLEYTAPVTKQRSVLRDRVVSGMLDAVAGALAELGAGASMTEIAEAAGVGRATLYRHFPTRDALLQGLREVAFRDMCTRIAEAELDTVDVRKGIARLMRIFVTSGAKYLTLYTPSNEAVNRDEVDQHINEPVRALLRRGVAEGDLRPDLPPEVLPAMLRGLGRESVQLVLRKEIGVEQAIDLAVSIFLDGTGNADQCRR